MWDDRGYVRHTAGIEPDIKDLLGVILVRQTVKAGGNCAMYD
jgi:hypothetical protein